MIFKDVVDTEFQILLKKGLFTRVDTQRFSGPKGLILNTVVVFVNCEETVL